MRPLSLGVLVGALARTTTPSTAAVPLSLGVHHLVDGALLSGAPNNTYFALGALVKDTEHPLVVPEHPWEQALHFYTSLVRLEPSGFLLYYGCSDATLFFNPIPLCVATSPDGRAWAKPLLNIHPYTKNGTQPPVPTNIVFITEPNTFGLHVFSDPRPGARARIVLAYESETQGARFVRAATSPDGLTFSPAAADPGAPPAIPFAGFADTAVSVTYDAAADAYTAFGRLDKGVPNSNASCPGANPVFRWIVSSTKKCAAAGAACSAADAANWSTPAIVPALAPGAPDTPSCLDSASAGRLALPRPHSLHHHPPRPPLTPRTRTPPPPPPRRGRLQPGGAGDP